MVTDETQRPWPSLLVVLPAPAGCTAHQMYIVRAQRGLFWRVFCFSLVRSRQLAVKCTNSTHFISRGFHGSTQTGRRYLVHLARRRHGVGHACGFCIFGARHGTPQEPGQCAGQDSGGLFSLDHRVFSGGLWRAYGTHFFVGAEQLATRNGFELVRFFFLLTFAAAIPAIISGGIAERARFWPQLIATAVIVV